MNITIPAETWNGLIRDIVRARAVGGIGCETKQTASGCLITGSGGGQFRHPWQVSARWRYNDSIQPLGGQWVANIWPGFVNGHDVTITEKRKDEAAASAEKTTVEVPLTDEEPPELAIHGFRNPVAPGGVEASLSGDIIVKPGEGYPKFFDQLGVVPAAKGGSGFQAMEPEADPTRTRQIRACDIVLVTPRMATRQTVDVLDPFTLGQTISIDTVFDNNALRNARSRHWLIAPSKWRPPEPPTPLDKLMGTAVEPQTDEIKLATLWVVSPPDAGEDDEPDETWTPYPQHFVFWNLNQASRAQMPGRPPEPLRFFLPLAGGVAQPIINAILDPINDANNQISAFLNAADFTGLYWST